MRTWPMAAALAMALAATQALGGSAPPAQPEAEDQYQLFEQAYAEHPVSPPPAAATSSAGAAPAAAAPFATPLHPSDPVIMESLRGKDRTTLAETIAGDLTSGKAQVWIDGLRSLKGPINEMNKAIADNLAAVNAARDSDIADVINRGSAIGLLDAALMATKIEGMKLPEGTAKEIGELVGRGRDIQNVAEAEGIAKKAWEMVKVGLGAFEEGSPAAARGSAFIAAVESGINVYKQLQGLSRIESADERTKYLLELQKSVQSGESGEMARLFAAIKAMERLQERINAGEKVTAEDVRGTIPGELLDDLGRYFEDQLADKQGRILVVPDGASPGDEPLKGKVEYRAPEATDYLKALQMRKLPPWGAGGDSGVGVPGATRAGKPSLPTAEAAEAGRGAWRSARAPTYGKGEEGQTALQKMYDRERAMRDAAAFKQLVPGRSLYEGSWFEKGIPCMTCHGSGRINTERQFGGQINYLKNEIARCQAIASQPIPPGPGAAQANFYRQQALAQLNYARQLLNSIPKEMPCPTCGGRGTLSR